MENFRMRRLFSLNLIGAFFNIFLPGIVGGDAVKAYYLYKNTGRMGQALASLFMDRYIGFICLMSIGLIAFPFGFSYYRGSWVEWMLPLIILCFVFASFILFGIKVGQRFSTVREIYGYFEIYKSRKKLLAKALLLSALVQGTVILSAYILSIGLGLSIPPLVFFLFFPIIATFSALPISISGIGLREASFVLLLGFVGVSPEMATALSFSWFLSVAFASLTGLLQYMFYKSDKIIHEPENP